MPLYLEMLIFSLINLAGAALIGWLIYKLVNWWQGRFARRSLKAIQQLEDEHYAGLHEALLRHAETMGKVDRQ